MKKVIRDTMCIISHPFEHLMINLATPNHRSNTLQKPTKKYATYHAMDGGEEAGRGLLATCELRTQPIVPASHCA